MPKRVNEKAHFLLVLCLFLFCFSPSEISAQTSGDIPYLTKVVDLEAIADTSVIESVLGLEPVTITFSEERDLRAPQNVQKISSDVKLQFGRQSMPQILNSAPGVLMHSGAFNTNRITIRGIGSRNLFGTAKIKAYLNDIPLTNGVGETSLEDIDLALIEDIKIVKGPTSSLYGAGLGGMIHLNTRPQNSRPSQLNLETAIGAYGLKTLSASAILKLDSKNRLLGNFNTTESDGYRRNNNYNRKGFALIGDHTLNPKFKISWIANYIDLFGQIPSSLNITDYNEDPRAAAFNWQSVNGFEDYTKWIAGISSAIQTSDNSILKISLFTNSFDSYESRPFNILQEDNNAIGIRSTFSLAINNDLSINAGLEGFKEKYIWQTFETDEGVQRDMISDNEEDRRYINLFLNTDYSLSQKAHLTAGINLNSTRYEYLDLFEADMIDFSGDYRFDAILSPYVNLNINLAQEDQTPLIVYGLLSHGFSPPSLEETLLPDGQINPEIQPEKGLNLEIGSRGNLGKSLAYKVSLYSMDVKDLLVARRTAADQFIGINAGRTLHNGAELNLTYNGNISKSISFQIQTDLSLHDYTFKEFVDGDEDYSGNPLTGTPAHIWRSQLDINIAKGLKVGFGHYSIGDQSLRDDNSIAFEGYTLWHGFAQYNTALTDRLSMDILARVENIFDTKHASMLLINAGSFGGRAPRYYYPGLPTNGYASIKFSYLL